MIGNSGCFGKAYQPPIDDIQEAGAAVSDIMAGVTVEDPGTTSPDSTSEMAAMMLCETVRRVRFLSWAVALLALYVVAKELK